jgi:hypothetical protein
MTAKPLVSNNHRSNQTRCKPLQRATRGIGRPSGPAFWANSQALFGKQRLPVGSCCTCYNVSPFLGSVWKPLLNSNKGAKPPNLFLSHHLIKSRLWRNNSSGGQDELDNLDIWLSLTLYVGLLSPVPPPRAVTRADDPGIYRMVNLFKLAFDDALTTPRILVDSTSIGKS